MIMNTYEIWKIEDKDLGEGKRLFTLLEKTETQDDLVTVCQDMRRKYFGKQLRISNGQFAVEIYADQDEDVSFQGLQDILNQGTGT